MRHLIWLALLLAHSPSLASRSVASQRRVSAVAPAPKGAKADSWVASRASAEFPPFPVRSVFHEAQDPDPRKPAAVRTANIPVVPGEILERLAQYQNVRGAGFQDFAPDGNVLISTRFANTSQLHLVHGPGGRREQITFFEEPVSNGVFVPATGEVLFTMGRGGDENYQIYRLDRSAGKAVLLTDGKSRHSLGVFQKNGRKVVFGTNKRNGRDTDQYLLDPATGETALLFETEKETWFVADWTADDSKALLLRYVSVNESYPYVLDAATKKRTPIPVPGKGVAAHDALKFAADGKSVYLSSDAEGEFKHLARIDLGTMKYEWLTKDIPWDVTDLEVHGGRVVFVVNEDGMSRAYLLDGGKRREVPIPMGTLSGLRFTRDGKGLGFSLSRPDAPGDVYVHDFEKAVRWTYSEVGGLDPKTFVTPERIRFRSFDGLEIPAYVFKPRKASKAPVIISIHGGPEGQSRPTFSSLAQFYVNELGCAVILPNVRGSTGYGKTFVALDNGVKREDSVRDIGALLDWIAKQPDLDAGRVAVIGGSYGGYMVLGSLVKFPDRIRAGVDIVGISNFITFLEKTSAYRQDLRRVEYGDERDPEVRAVLEKISPVNRVDRIRSKLLVIHGKNDPRVPVGEAEQIASKVDGAWLMIADNEGHGFARKENRDYSNAVVALFFRKHLIGE